MIHDSRHMVEPEVIYEDKNFLAMNKPAGLLVHGIKSQMSDVRGQRSDEEAEETLVDWLVKRYPEIRKVGDDPKTRPGIVHRLDRDASGVMLVAKNQKYFEYLKSLFQKHLIRKVYLALVFGKVGPRGRIEKPIGIRSGTVKRSVASSKMLKEAVTDYRLKKIFEAGSDKEPQYFSLIEVEPKTGRTHQIRVHLSSIGHPIVGDKLYGSKPGARRPTVAEAVAGGRQVPGARLMLHSLSLEFSLAEGLASPQSHERDVGGRRFKVEAEPPADYQRTLDLLASNAEITYPQKGG